MNDLGKRALGYGLAGIAGGLLVYGGFVYEADPDLMTMLGSVEVQLTQAAMMTRGSQLNRDVATSRAKLMAEANRWLDRVDAAYPDTAWSPWYRGFVAYLDADYDKAAGLYEQTRFRADCTDDLRDKAVINQARMLSVAGRPALAARLLRQHGGRFLAEHSDLAKAELAAAEASAARPAAPATAEAAPAK